MTSRSKQDVKDALNELRNYVRRDKHLVGLVRQVEEHICDLRKARTAANDESEMYKRVAAAANDNAAAAVVARDNTNVALAKAEATNTQLRRDLQLVQTELAELKRWRSEFMNEDCTVPQVQTIKEQWTAAEFRDLASAVVRQLPSPPVSAILNKDDYNPLGGGVLGVPIMSYDDIMCVLNVGSYVLLGQVVTLLFLCGLSVGIGPTNYDAKDRVEGMAENRGKGLSIVSKWLLKMTYLPEWQKQIVNSGWT